MPTATQGKPAATLKRFFIIDFDSTFVRDETIDVLAEIALQGNPEKNTILDTVRNITNEGMEGKITFSESLKKRLALFAANRGQVDMVTERLKERVSASVLRNKEFFQKEGNAIYILSNGFKECIVPIAAEYGIPESHVLANSMRFDEKGILVGVGEGPLSEGGGKVTVVKNLALQGEVVVIGDGMTDYEIRKSGAAERFYAFTENVMRQSVVAVADKAIASFDELLYELNLPRAQSYPKSKLKVLLLENVDASAAEHFKEEGYQIETATKALGEEELIEKIRDVSILGIRSTTNVTKRVLENAPHLLAVGAFCIGTNQIDLAEASRRGVAVFNAPYANGRSVVEMVIGFIIMLSRRLGDKNMELHKGVWNKSAKGAFEIRGKTLGIVGYGSIGTQLSVVAESLGMHVVFYDFLEKAAMGNAKKAHTLEELLAVSDIVTLHVDGRSANKGIIGKESFDKMKKGAFFINASRGFVVDMDALAEALKDGRLGGAALDVHPDEPKESPGAFTSKLQNVPNVVLTPHIGGATTEAQKSIAEYLSAKLSSFVDTGNSTLSVNLPGLSLPKLKNAHRFIHIHRNIPGVLAKINTLMGARNVNILGQYLGTNQEVGYVITDVDTAHGMEIVKELKEMPETIRFRTLY
jgi:D-3-phosphoglycerate dehydrogenase